VTAWCSQTTPGTSGFLPVAVAGIVELDERSTWRLLKQLGDRAIEAPSLETRRRLLAGLENRG